MKIRFSMTRLDVEHDIQPPMREVISIPVMVDNIPTPFGVYIVKSPFGDIGSYRNGPLTIVQVAAEVVNRLGMKEAFLAGWQSHIESGVTTPVDRNEAFRKWLEER